MDAESDNECRIHGDTWASIWQQAIKNRGALKTVQCWLLHPLLAHQHRAADRLLAGTCLRIGAMCADVKLRPQHVEEVAIEP